MSRYLFMQLVVNAGFGIPFGIALYFIGIPNAMLWGLLATLLRFIPYAGCGSRSRCPVTLAFAISDGWSLVAWTVGVFLALELIFVYAVEPWLYGRSAGLSPIAIIAAALFWTWLWGPVGLLLATPLTVCVAVMGRYIPELGYPQRAARRRAGAPARGALLPAPGRARRGGGHRRSPRNTRTSTACSRCTRTS